MNTNDYEINYEDERFQAVEAEKNAQLTQTNSAYDQIINNSDKFYQDQQDLLNQYKDQQVDFQNQQTQLTVDTINQQKEQTEKDYLKEQKGAYVDYAKATNQYGANAETMAANGLTNTGYSETVEGNMFSAYQNRVAVARETFQEAVVNYTNQIKEAKLAGSSKIAEIVFNTLSRSLELSLEGFQYKNNLILDKINKQREIDNTYYSRWQDVQNQMNQENQFQEQIRQYNESMALEREQMQEQIRQYEQDYTFKKQQFNEDIRQFNEQIAYYKAKDAEENRIKIQQLEEQKRQAQQEQANWEKEYQLQVKQVNASLAKAKASSSSAKLSNGSSSSSSSSKLSSGSSSSSSSSSKSSSNSSKYNSIMSTARTLYNTSKSKSGSAFVEDYLARAINSGDISTTQASTILKNLGIK